jgi:hypothetical protein
MSENNERKLRKIVLAVSILLFTTAVHAQVMNTQVTTVFANFNTTLLLNLDNSAIEFEFNTFEDYHNGVGSHNGDYYTEGSIAATTNWELSFMAAEPFLHDDGVTTMPLDNLGVTVKWTGYNKVKNRAKNHAKSLESSEVLLIEQQGNKSNAGDETANSFILYWQLGTGDGNMNSQSIFDQDLKKGSYSTSVEFIVSEAL